MFGHEAFGAPASNGIATGTPVLIPPESYFGPFVVMPSIKATTSFRILVRLYDWIVPALNWRSKSEFTT